MIQNLTLSVFQDKERKLPTAAANHKLDRQSTTRVVRNSPQIEELIKKHPDVVAEQRGNTYKRLQRGLYIGPLEDGIPQGKGKIRYSDGSIYIGNFSNGKAEGKGLMIYTKDQFYYGNFSKNNMEGQGQYNCEEYTYQGQMKQNTFDGKGILNFLDGKGRFQGQFRDGLMHRGLMTWEVLENKKKQLFHRYSYEGFFKNNKFEDQNGELVCPNGKYYGGFKNGMKEGQGKFLFTEKYQYVGQYHQNLKCGKGTLYNPNTVREGQNAKYEYSTATENISYTGMFKNNVPHGLGAKYSDKEKKLVNGEYEQGIWANHLSNIQE